MFGSGEHETISICLFSVLPSPLCLLTLTALLVFSSAVPRQGAPLMFHPSLDTTDYSVLEHLE